MVRLKQLAQDGASDGDAVVYNIATGAWEPADVLAPSGHPSLRDLIHFIDTGPAAGFASGAVEVITGYPFPTNKTWYADGSLTDKIVEYDNTWSGAKLLTRVWRMYDSDGETVLVTLTDTFTYDGSNAAPSGRTRTWT